MATCRLSSWLCVLLSSAACADVRTGTVFMNGPNATFLAGVMDKARGAAFGFYNASVLQSGWGVLEVHVGKQDRLRDEDRAFAFGYLEGWLLAPEIVNHTRNMKAFWLKRMPGTRLERIYKWLLDQERWSRNFTEKNAADPLARATSYVLRQNEGVLRGVQHRLGARSFSKLDQFLIINGGDLIDLDSMFSEKPMDFASLSHLERLRYLNHKGMCSALVKVTPGLENVFMAHATWFTYRSMLRIFKHYNFDLDDAAIATKRISFSSYPGLVASLDAFYILDSQMVMLQTTNNILDHSLYRKVTPASLLSWQRVRAAHHLATSGSEWAHVFTQHNSGTYNNQYMLVDLKKIHAKKRIDHGALTIVEQIPGLVMASDQTRIVQNGYWPSYNIPFHEEIYNLSGYAAFARKYGSDFSYQMAPRAKIFRRDANNVSSIDDFRTLMRSNNYKHDPYSQDVPSNAICSRGDLETESPSLDGCIDGKVTDLKMALQMRSFAINGPTTAGETLPPFSWNDPKYRNITHAGLPPIYTFDWTLMQSTLM